MPEYDSTITYCDISGFPGYKVGSDGTVWCCRGRGSLRGALINYWRQLKPCPGTDGHLQVALYCDRRSHRHLIHRLVLEAFVGPCPTGLLARHFPDRSPANNRLENLSWGTQADNYADSIIHNTNCRGERHGMTSLTADTVRAIRETRGQSLQSLARTFGVSKSTVSRVIRRKVWKHV